MQGLLSSQVVAGLVTGARVVKAFNHLRAEILGSDPRVDGGRRVLFYSGDDESAKAEVAELIDRVGFAGIDLGPLAIGGKLMQFPGGPCRTRTSSGLDDEAGAGPPDQNGGHGRLRMTARMRECQLVTHGRDDDAGNEEDWDMG